jgi:predicted transcriptional regulator of viral defense system
MHPDLLQVAARQCGLFTSEDARRAGYRPDETRALLSTGRWRRIRRGIYLDGDRHSAVRARPRMWHVTQCAAVLVALGPGPVISHSSAARVHRFIVPSGLDDDVRLTDAVQWRRGRGYRVARADLPAGDLWRLEAFHVTAPARTLVDCTREWPLTDSVVALDAALRSEQVTRAELEAAVLRARHWVGIGSAARACGLADGRAESPLETRGRVALLAAGLPRPELQVELRDGSGLLARVDAWYDEAGVAVEFDGRVKYLDPRDGRDPGEVLWREKRREDRVRELGVRFVRLAQEDVGPGRRRDLAQRLGGMLATPLIRPRAFTVVRTAEPGSSMGDVA